MKKIFFLLLVTTSIFAQNCKERPPHFPPIDTTLTTLNCLNNGEREGYWVHVKDSANWMNKRSDFYGQYMKWSEGSYKSGKKIGRWLHLSWKGCVGQHEKTVVYDSNGHSTETVYNHDSQVIISKYQGLPKEGHIK